MLKTIKVKLYLTDKQREMMNNHFGACRFIYNSALEYKKTLYQDYKINVSKYDIINQLTDVKRAPEFNWLNNIKAETLQNIIDNLEFAYKKFFKGVGFPKFKSKKLEQSFIQKQSCRILKNSNKIVFYNNKLKFKCSKKDSEILQNNIIKRIIYKKDNLNNYYASILIEFEPEKLTNSNKGIIGIDLGLTHYIITSDGEFIDNPKFFRKSEKKLSKLQQLHSRKKKSSKNKEKARIKLATQYKKITNQRNHFLHNLSKQLINENKVICLEHLNIQGMIQNRHLSKSIQDASWSKFVGFLKYKASWYNTTILQLSTFSPTSKTCSNCGWVNKELTLSDRTFECNECGYIEDRDINAAINMINFSRDELTRIYASGDCSVEWSKNEEINIKFA